MHVVRLNAHLARPARTRRRQGGFTVVESLVAILLFAVGVLGIARLQSIALQQTNSVEFRSVAAMQAKAIIGRMWMSDRTQATLATNFSGTAGTGGTEYTAWLSAVQSSGLPGVTTSTLMPTVVVTSQTGGGASPLASSLVTVTVYWKAPGDSATHYYIETAQMK